MCIGFSVDFSAHISYAYLTAKVKTTEQKIQECLYSLGLPILQGGISTVVCVVTFTLAPSYVYMTFFKIVFLVVISATIHGLFLIPVFLSLFGRSKTPPVPDINIPRVKLIYSKDMKDTHREPYWPGVNRPVLRPDPEGCSNRSFGKENDKNDNETER